MNILALDWEDTNETKRPRRVIAMKQGENKNVICCRMRDEKRKVSKENKVIRQLTKTARKYAIRYAFLGNAAEGTETGRNLLHKCGLSLCDGKVLHAPLYPIAVRKLAAEAGIGLMEQPVTVAGGMDDVVEFIWQMKDAVKYFAVAGGEEYADMITYLYDEYGISVRLVEEAHSGICVAANGQTSRLRGDLVLDFSGATTRAIRVCLHLGIWSERLKPVAEEYNLGAAEAVLRMMGEQPKEAVLRCCERISLIRGKSV